MGDSKHAQDYAYRAAGVEFFDHRSSRAAGAEWDASDRLERYVTTLNTIEQLRVEGAAMCVRWLPEPDNEN